MVGFLAVRIAFHRGWQADTSGALASVARTPGGKGVLWLMVLGFAGLALWWLAEAAYGQPTPDGGKPSRRLVSLARASFYTFLCITTAAFTIGSGGQSSGRCDRDAAGSVLESRSSSSPNGPGRPGKP